MTRPAMGTFVSLFEAIKDAASASSVEDLERRELSRKLSSVRGLLKVVWTGVGLGEGVGLGVSVGVAIEWGTQGEEVWKSQLVPLCMFTTALSVRA